MKTVGIIAEFNPFHNAHQYLVRTARANAGADAVVAVMSGHFVQRGEGAVYSKWYRAQTAVSGGVDLVIELPTVYSLQSADFFACGALRLMEALSVDSVAFGVENATLSELLAVNSRMYDPSFSQRRTEYLSQGMSYSSACQEALKVTGTNFAMLPNHTLALAYLEAAKRIGFSPDWIPVRRIGALHDRMGTDTVTSASHVRELLHSSPDLASSYLPYAPTTPESEPQKLEAMILSNLRRMSKKELSLISGVSEGLENRLKSACQEPNYSAFLKKAVTKRYPEGRIRRIALSALLRIERDQPLSKPEYLRVLALNDKGRQFIHENKGKLALPFVVKVADASPSRMLEIDCLATDLWSLTARDARGGIDYLKSPVYLT